jgi:hypothetical protein
MAAAKVMTNRLGTRAVFRRQVFQNSGGIESGHGNSP